MKQLSVLVLFMGLFFSGIAQNIKDELKKGPSLSFPIGVTKDDMDSESNDFKNRPDVFPEMAKLFPNKAKLMGSFYLTPEMGAFLVVTEIKKGLQEFHLMTYSIKTNQKLDSKQIGSMNKPGDGNNTYQTFEIDKNWDITIDLEKTGPNAPEPKTSMMKIQKDGKIKKAAVQE